MSIKDGRKRASREEQTRREKLTPKANRLRVLPKSKIRDPRIRMVVDFMRANLHRKISLLDMGREVALTGDHVSRLFTPQTGLPPGEYLIRLRMKAAEHLLKKSLLSIKEIMARTGYGNRGHFINQFRRYFDVTPSEYKKRSS